MLSENSLDRKIIYEIYMALLSLGAEDDLLLFVHGWKFTLSEENVFKGLEFWNLSRKNQLQEVVNKLDKLKKVYSEYASTKHNISVHEKTDGESLPTS